MTSKHLSIQFSKHIEMYSKDIYGFGVGISIAWNMFQQHGITQKYSIVLGQFTLSPLHTRQRPRRPRCVLNFFQRTQWGRGQNRFFCITRFFFTFLVRPLQVLTASTTFPPSHYLAQCHACTTSSTFKLRPYYGLTMTRKTFLRVHHAPFTFWLRLNFI
jgi:hypothetical protein